MRLKRAFIFFLILVAADIFFFSPVISNLMDFWMFLVPLVIKNMFLVGFLAFLGLKLKWIKPWASGLVTGIVYFAIATFLIHDGYAGQAKEPNIWEGVGPLLAVLCPFSTMGARIVMNPPIHFLPDIIIGFVYYCFIGSVVSTGIAPTRKEND
jgi:hypothetical protein